MPCKIMKCSCEHEFQDKKYGYKNRIFNSDKEVKSYKCTVCGAKK